MKKIALLLTLCTLAFTSQAETLWGYTTGNDFKSNGCQYVGEYRVAMWVPYSEALSHQKIVALNIPVRSSLMEEVSIWGGSTLNNKSAFSQTVSEEDIYKNSFNSNHAFYHRVDLTSPVEITAPGLYVGYTFTIDEMVDIYDQNPVGLMAPAEGSQVAEKSLYVAFSSYGGAWEDWAATKNRMSALQLFLEGEDTAKDYVSLSNATAQSFVLGSEGYAIVGILSYSKTPISSIGYDVTCGGVPTSSTITLDQPIPAGLNVMGTIELPFALPTTAGHYDATLRITHINGAANETSAPTTTNLGIDVLSRAGKRLTVVEDVTGTGCAFCPSGWVIMEHIKDNLADKAVVVSMHAFNTYSPLFVPEYDNSLFPNSRAPLCMVDRKTPLFDPYFGYEGASAVGWTYDLNESLPEAEITVKADYIDGTYAAVQAEASTEFLTDLPGSYLAFVLTADGLTGTTPDWKQLNAYYSFAPEDYPENLRPFCEGGIYGQNYTTLVYNDVLISSSWRPQTEGSETNVNEVAPFSTTSATQKATSTYTIPMPTSEKLLKAIDLDRVYVTALVVKADGTVANAARCKVGNVEAGIHGITVDKSISGASYDLMGRQQMHTPISRGFYIQKGKKHIR